MYTENENKVLLHFFTNTDKNIYCATDNMPMELWALLLGGYSRSSESMRDRFLQVFKDISSEIQSDYEDTLQLLVADLTISSEFLAKALAKASNFMSKWAISYGHNSLKDSCFNMIAIEGVSIRASKILEDSKLGAFQEKSTRYMDFSGDSISEYAVNVEGKELLNEAMNVYSNTKNALIEYYKTIINKDDFKTENAWIRTCNAKAFDDARYLLPTSIKTSLGVTMTTRETERWLSKLLSNSLPEIKDLASSIKEECIKITPSLIKHVTANKFLNNINSKLYEKFTEFDSNISTVVDQEAYGAKLIDYSNVEDSVRFNVVTSLGLFDQDHILSIAKEISNQKLDVFELAFSERGPHDDFPSECATGYLHFEIICDIGAFRDIQRHRVGTQVIEKWNSFRGYSIPDSLSDEGLAALRSQYVDIMDRISEFNKKLVNDREVSSEYYLLLGHNVRFSYQCDFRQFAYLVELRSGESGHYSYRRIAQQMYTEFASKFPNLAKHVRVNMNEYSDRRKAEEVIQEKISKIKLSEVQMTKVTEKF